MYGRQSHKIKSLYNDVSFCVFFWSKWHINDNAMINNNEKKTAKTYGRRGAKTHFKLTWTWTNQWFDVSFQFS